ncbi:MAG: DNA translocase FtsK [Candidatus Omnitrophica bacterium]|nr:DNA translocase FtsK [Candidatus Omnitrophota bacterium]
MRQGRKINEIKGLIILASGLIILMSLVSFSWEDIKLFSFPYNIPSRNWVRTFGVYVAGVLLFFFGWSSYLICGYIIWGAIRLFKNRPFCFRGIQILGFLIFLISLSGLFSLLGGKQEYSKFLYGGFMGMWLEQITNIYFGKVGSLIIFLTFVMLSFSLISDILVSVFFIKVFYVFNGVIELFKSYLYKRSIQKKDIDIQSVVLNKKRKILSRFLPEQKQEDSTLELKSKTASLNITPTPQISIKEVDLSKRKIQLSLQKTVSSTKRSVVEESQDYKFPSLDLLDSPPPLAERQIKEDLTANARILEETLADFGISAKVTHIERGPVITRYELEPAAGVKLQKIVSLGDDIALNLKAQSVRIVAPIPGKGRVGVEVPNSQSSFVYLKEVLTSEEFQGSSSKLTLAIGKDITGRPVIADLRDMPHLLIAGTTGSGKTVCVNCLILSILFHASPQEVKFIMIDPKMVELAVFNEIPHLLSPVLTEVKKVKMALNWLVNEMEERYRLFAKIGVRNIDGYNQKQEKLPYIVVIIDELADLMMVAGEHIESAITRLAQLSRAVGIHLILATQRPSVDVITGIIKANFPARISFKVASKVDSRTVLDMNGADMLLGKGDLLFLKPGESRPIRAQGSLVSEKEIERVVEFIRKQGKPVYEEEILQEGLSSFVSDQKDEFYEEAVRIIMETGQASASILQRRLRMGYTRAARIIDMMEQEGLLGPYEGSKPRKILVDREEWLRKNISSKDEQK